MAVIGDPRAVWALYDLFSRECPRCGGRVHPLVDLDAGTDHLVLVETPLEVSTSDSWLASDTVTITASKWVGMRRCSEFDWPLPDDDGGERACTPES